MSAEAERCRREIAEIEALLLVGHPDVEGLCMALSDWWTELRLIEQEVGLESGAEKQNRRRIAEPGGGED